MDSDGWSYKVSVGNRWVLGQLLLLAGLAVAIAYAGAEPHAGTTAVAVVLFLIGQGMALVAVWQMRRHLTAHPSPVPGASLLRNGIYGLARHPMYGGVVLVAAAASTFDRNPIAWVVTVALALLFVGKSNYEERLLSEVFVAYPTYKQTVTRRFLPGVW